MTDEIQKRIDERIRIKDNQRSDTELSIRISWAINNSVNLVANYSKPSTHQGLENEIRYWTDWFLIYFDEKKTSLMNEYEKEYQDNPAPTPDQYVKMPQSQQKFLKDKQLESNRKAYQERKPTCESCHGTASRIDPLVNGMHAKCRTTEFFRTKEN